MAASPGSGWTWWTSSAPPSTDPMPAAASSPGPKRTLYGRRQGRKLRPGRVALLDTLLPTLAVPLPDDQGRLEWRAPFPRPGGRLWHENGYGAGAQLSQRTANSRDSRQLDAT